MDSNFQVKISADISDLQNRIRSVEGSLKTLGSVAESSSKTISSSFETTSASIQKVGMDMNRARLATFAFGQVIRDAGFFSQSFGLGMLAISNNIPILVDQLVLLSGVSAGFGAVLSVVGSLLAAGLTVFAYWAQGVEREGGTVSGAISKMGNDSESAIGKLVDYLNTPPASDMLGKAVAGLEESISMISQIMKAGVDLIIAIWDSFGTDISAVLGVFYEVVSNQFNNVLNIVRFASSIIKGDFTGAFEAILNIGKNVLNSLIGLIQNFVRITSTLLGAVVGAIDPLKGEIIKNAGRELFAFGEGLKFASSSAGEATFSFKDFFNGLFKGQKEVTKTKKSIDDLAKSTIQLSRSQPVMPTQPDVQLAGVGVEISDEELAATLKRFEDINRQANFMKNFNDATNAANESVIALVRTVGNDLVNSFLVMMDTGKFSFEAIGQSLLNMIKRLVAAAAAAAVLSVILGSIFGKSTNTGFKSIFGMISGLNLGAGVAPSSATSIGSIATNGINTSINSSNAMSSGGGVLETRVSGNDLVILLDRASNNRNKYF